MADEPSRESEPESYFTPPQAGARPQRRLPPASGSAGAGAGVDLDVMLAIVRMVAGAAGAIAIFLIAKNTSDTFTELREVTDLSAIQVVQIYTEGLFWMIFTVGMLVAAYVATRWSR